MTGYNKDTLQEQLDKRVTFQMFFAEAPKINPNIALIKGTICGVKVEEITDDITKKVRYLDKLIDELAKGKTMQKILRTE